MRQVSIQSNPTASVFRTRAWVQAWIDTWGSHPSIKLIDLGGRNDPLEKVYISRQYLKKCLPIHVLSLAGVGCAALPTPRAEYNDISPLINLAGGLAELSRLLGALRWQRFIIPDVLTAGETPQQLKEIASHQAWSVQIETSELTYHISPQPWSDYVAALGSNTRLAYVNRRNHLSSHGIVQHESWSLEQADSFFLELNKFHLQRWGRPCFSAHSQSFLKNFAARLQDEQGKLLFQILRVDGDVVAVLLDIEWNGTRYNLQSGFFEQRFPKIALGALHMGYDIEDALQQGYGYDFMAGQGKHSNYKERIATDTQPLSSFYMERGLLQRLRQLKQHISTSESPA